MLSATLSVAVAALTLLAPVCPVLAMGDDGGCCCAHEEEPPAGSTLDAPPCPCAEPDEGHAAAASPVVEPEAPLRDGVAPAAPTARLPLPRSIELGACPGPSRAPPPPRLHHVTTVVLRR
ncbi:MAG: hypothetical protein PVI30_04430 [Myxococcales bacterium]